MHDDGTRIAALRRLIADAFAGVERPGDWALVNSHEGDEPALLVQELTGSGDWRTLDDRFLDELPSGYGSALSFFSDEALRHFLPAYLIADLEGALHRANPVFHLTHGLDGASALEPVNPRRYGARTWRDVAVHRFSTFRAGEAAAIVAYLEQKAATDSFYRPSIEQALASYWRARAAR